MIFNKEFLRVAYWKWLVLILLTAVFLYYAFSKPKYAFDVIPYTGCIYAALQDGPVDWGQAHQDAYQHLKSKFPEDVYKHVTQSSPTISRYREILATDPEAFRQRAIGSSCYKIGFLAPVVGLVKVGVPVYQALQIVGAVPAGLFFFIVGIWLAGRYHVLLWIPLLIVGSLTGLLQTARYEYPDGLTALLIGGALIGFVERRLSLACFLFLTVLLVRVDAILYFGAFLGYVVFIAQKQSRMRFLTSLPWGCAALLIYFAIALYFETPSFSALFYHSYYAQIPYLLDFKETISVSFYFTELWEQMKMVASKGWKYPLLALGALGALIIGVMIPKTRSFGDLSAVSLSMVVFHFFFIPWFDTRYYAALYMMIVIGFGLALFTVLRDHLSSRGQRLKSQKSDLRATTMPLDRRH